MRSAGGLGESATGSTQPSRAAVCVRLGNKDATCPSGPTPNRIKSKTGKPAAQAMPCQDKQASNVCRPGQASLAI